jgi:predicted nucleotidyltransferase
VNFGLADEVIKSIQNIFAKFPQIDTVMIYGSRAMGNFREGSDIDLTIKGNDLDFQRLNQIELAIDDLMLPYKIDLSIYSRLNNSSLIEHIDRVGLVFYKK